MKTQKDLNALKKDELIKIIKNYEERLSVIDECDEVLRMDSMNSI
jgi:hypothetical protein|tara:strand:- start:6546 stop:6680 length:135 start_codon:yes stop_codon:yes gene_type:complete